MKPLVSIITATYRAAGTIAACLGSVAAQDYENIEHLIVDGGSEDDTGLIVAAHAGPQVTWISEPDHGIFDAWNKGLRRARGEWIAFLGADDLYLPHAVASYMHLATSHPDAMYLSSRVEWIGPEGKPRTIGRPWQWNSFRRYMCTAHVGSMHRRSLFETYGEFDPTYRFVGDYEFLLRPQNRLRAAFMPQVTARMQGGGKSDCSPALDEAARAKRETGGRPRTMTALDLARARAIFHGRRAVSQLARNRDTAT